jgi:hypothetical protein
MLFTLCDHYSLQSIRSTAHAGGASIYIDREKQFVSVDHQSTYTRYVFDIKDNDNYICISINDLDRFPWGLLGSRFTA